MRLENKTVLGIYSDPAALAIELAVIETDGLDIKKVHQTRICPYPHELREQLLIYAAQKQSDPALFNQLNHDVSQFFIQSAKELLEELAPLKIQVDLVALSGHTAQHNPAQKVHFNFGDAQMIATALQKPVAHHFVKEDLNAGGVGSPLLTTFWGALCQKTEKPVCIIALGGISHLVYIGPVGELVGFDVGVGLSLLDRWVLKHTGQELDFNGALAAKGKTDERVLNALMRTKYLLKKPPKSVQKTDFDIVLEQVEGLSPEDGAATLTTFVCQSIIEAQKFLPATPALWIFIGGGTYNPTLMLQLARQLPNIQTAKEVLPYTESLNAMGFAFIATRHLMGLPISFPETTGVRQPLSGAEITQPE